MIWTPDRPVESGDYWFRRAENNPPQVVKVKRDKVIFRSGKTQNISSVQGEWGGAVTSSAGPISAHSPFRESPKTETWRTRIGILLVGAIVGALLNEPYFSYVGEEKGPEVVEELSTTRHKISITVFPIFRNWGLKPGHLEKVEFSHRELHIYPEDVKLNYCDKAPIPLLSVLSGKSTVCNFVVTFEPQKAIKDQLYFQVSYYGPGGHEIHTETYTVTATFKPFKTGRVVPY